MTKLIVQNIISQTGDSIDFKDRWTVNNSPQWLDTYGVIKTNSDTIDDSPTIPSGTNGMSAGTIRIGVGQTVTVQGEWRII
jgi:hypothetical protein